MTLHATRDGQSITINGNIGTEVLVKDGRVQHVRITEDASHVRYFHGQLGKLLDAADEELKAAAQAAEPSHEHHHGHGQST